MSTEAQRRVLVVVPTLNEVTHLAGVLESLCTDWPMDARVTLVVADGGSTDGTRAEFERVAAGRSGLHWLANPLRRQGAAVNLAVQRFGDAADVLIRCDAHAGYPPSFVRRLLDSLDRHGADAVVVAMDSVGASCLQQAIAWVSDTRVGSGGSAHRGGQRSGFVDHGHHAAMRLASFRRAGGYDEHFTHNEDAELDCRQRGLGSRIWLDADIRLRYEPRATLGALVRQYFAYGRGRSRTLQKHPHSWRVRQLLVPAHVVLLLGALLAAPWCLPALAWPALYLAALSVVSLQLALRHRSACGLLGGVAAGCMHLAWGLGFLAGWLSLRESVWVPAAAALP